MAGMIYKWRHWSLAGFFACNPQVAMASSCDTAKITARTVDETAQIVWDTSDYLGLAVAQQMPGAPVRQQQKIIYLVALKGAAKTVYLEPLRLNGVARNDDSIRWIDIPLHSLKLVGLVKTESGAVAPLCLVENIDSKPIEELYKALIVRRNATSRSNSQK